jgi:hypothetical protein
MCRIDPLGDVYTAASSGDIIARTHVLQDALSFDLEGCETLREEASMRVSAMWQMAPSHVKAVGTRSLRQMVEVRPISITAGISSISAARTSGIFVGERFFCHCSQLGSPIQ